MSTAEVRSFQIIINGLKNAISLSSHWLLWTNEYLSWFISAHLWVEFLRSPSFEWGRKITAVAVLPMTTCQSSAVIYTHWELWQNLVQYLNPVNIFLASNSEPCMQATSYKFAMMTTSLSPKVQPLFKICNWKGWSTTWSLSLPLKIPHTRDTTFYSVDQSRWFTICGSCQVSTNFAELQIIVRINVGYSLYMRQIIAPCFGKFSLDGWDLT